MPDPLSGGGHSGHGGGTRCSGRHSSRYQGARHQGRRRQATGESAVTPDSALHRSVRDPYLPPDREAFVASGATRRIIVIAPTRAACETIELAFTLDIETVLWRERGPELAALAERFHAEDVAWKAGDSRRGFGIVAGTGTGKTLSIRPIAQTLLGVDKDGLKVGVINREREATPDSPSWNVVIVTTGIARRWFQDGDIRAQDTLVVDEIHQTSAELELCLALGKREIGRAHV